MKLKNLFFAFVALAGFAFVSCSDDDDEQQFSTASVEENKALIQENGLAMLSEVKAIQSSPSALYLQNGTMLIMRGNMLASNPQLQTKNSEVLASLIHPLTLAADLNMSNVASFAKGEVNPMVLYISMWSKLTGTYTWNYENGEWAYTQGGDEIIIKFPSAGLSIKSKGDDAPVNDAVIRFYGLKTVTGTYAWADDATVLPTALKCELKVYSTTYFNFDFNAAYKTSDSHPSSLKVNLEMQKYKLAIDASNNDTKGSASVKLTKGDQILMAMKMDAKGEWTAAALNTDPEFGDVIASGNASLQIMNVKVEGNVDVESINKAMASYANIVIDSLSIAAQCDIINKNAKLALCFVDSNRIIAKIIAYPSSDEEWNEVTQQYEKEFEIGFAFQFADNSVMDSRTYFSEGFELFLSQMRYFGRD